MSKKELDQILSKPMSAINEYDVSILRARRSYLSDVELERYADFLEEKEKGEDEVPIEEMKFKALKELCVQRGIEVPTTVKSKEAILALIAEAEEKEKGEE